MPHNNIFRFRMALLPFTLLCWSCNSPTGPDSEKAFSRVLDGENDDIGMSVAQTFDGGYIVGATTESDGSPYADFWLIKLDREGNRSWDRTFGGSDWDRLRAVRQTSDAGYILLGYTWGQGAGATDLWLLKTESNGYKVWGTTYGGAATDQGWDVQETYEGGYIMVGATESAGAGGSDLWLVRTDPYRAVLWTQPFGGGGYEAGFAVLQTADSGFVAAGVTALGAAGGMNAYLVRTDSAGSVLWANTYGQAADDTVFSLAATADGGYILAGTSGTDALLIKTNAVGKKSWLKTFGGPAEDTAREVVLSGDGGYVLAGTTRPAEDDDTDIWLLKVDKDGQQVWSRTFDGGADDHGQALAATDDGGYIITGSTLPTDGSKRSVWVIKTDSKGKSVD